MSCWHHASGERAHKENKPEGNQNSTEVDSSIEMIWIFVVPPSWRHWINHIHMEMPWAFRLPGKYHGGYCKNLLRGDGFHLDTAPGALWSPKMCQQEKNYRQPLLFSHPFPCLPGHWVSWGTKGFDGCASVSPAGKQRQWYGSLLCTRYCSKLQTALKGGRAKAIEIHKSAFLQRVVWIYSLHPWRKEELSICFFSLIHEKKFRDLFLPT